MPKLYNTVTSNNHKYFTTSNTAIQIKMANIMYDQMYQKIMKKQRSGTVKKTVSSFLILFNFLSNKCVYNFHFHFNVNQQQLFIPLQTTCECIHTYISSTFQISHNILFSSIT